MDARGKAEISQVFRERKIDADVITNPGSIDVPFVEVRSRGEDVGYLCNVLAVHGIMNNPDRAEGPSLQIRAFSQESGMAGTFQNVLFEDVNAPRPVVE